MCNSVRDQNAERTVEMGTFSQGSEEVKLGLVVDIIDINPLDEFLNLLCLESHASGAFRY